MRLLDDADPAVKAGFRHLLELEGLDRLDELMRVDDFFEELPLYSRYAQLSFLDGLPVAERNRLLVRAAVSYLPVVLDHARDYYAGRDRDYFCMVAVQSWEDFDEGGLVTPYLWFANPSRGVFDHLRFDPPQSSYSAFVAEALDHDPSFMLNEGLRDLPGGPYVERVYVRLVSKEGKP